MSAGEEVLLIGGLGTVLMTVAVWAFSRQE